MMIDCNNCHAKIGTPRGAAGIFTLLPAAAVTGLLLGFLVAWGRRHGYGWSGWAAMVVALPLWVLFSWVLYELPRWLTRLRFRFRPCPQCGARDWGRPYYSGFGL